MLCETKMKNEIISNMITNETKLDAIQNENNKKMKWTKEKGTDPTVLHALYSKNMVLVYVWLSAAPYTVQSMRLQENCYRS